MFKRCPNCGYKWPTREELLIDPDIELLGYQVNFERLKAGIILFNHTCKGTLALYVTDFADLYTGPIFTQRATGSEQCPGHCLHQDDFRPCPAKCECAYVRHILQKLKNWPKCKDAVVANSV